MKNSLLLRALTGVVWIVAAVAAFGQAIGPNHERGFSPGKAYEASELDAINLFNGNLNVPVPLGPAFSVGGTLSYQFLLSYSGNSWEGALDPQLVDENNDNQLEEVFYEWSFPTRSDNAGMGWRLHFGRLMYAPCGGGNNTLAYESPDGAVHCFYTTLHDGQSSEASQTAGFTRDGTYLRVVFGETTTTVEFPNGNRHEFDSLTDANPKFIKRMYDRFGNEVTFDYAPVTWPSITNLTPTKVWLIEDSLGRKQYVYFRSTPSYHEEVAALVPHDSVAAVRLTAFDPNGGASAGAAAVYTFKYEGEDDDTWSDVQRPCYKTGDDIRHHSFIGFYVKAPLLKEVTLPENQSYKFVSSPNAVVETACAGGGFLTSMTLPTGGKVTWNYEEIGLPVRNLADKWVRIAFNPSIKVKERRTYGSTGPQMSLRTYDTLYAAANGQTVEISNVVTDYAANGTTRLKKSRHFFTTCLLSCSASGLRVGEYGLPLSRLPQTGFDNPVNDYAISSVEYGPGSNWEEILRRNYVKYEADRDMATYAPIGSYDFNRRLSASRTVYANGDSIDTEHSDWDGLGHYRTTAVSGNFGGSRKKTSTTNYNAIYGWPSSFTMPSAWLLETYSSAVVKQTDTVTNAETVATTEACFDANTGALLRKRTWRGNAASRNDLLSIFSYTAGNLTQESHYGGDTPDGGSAPLPDNLNTCSGSPGTAAYSISHEYQYGVRKKSTYSGQTFSVLDLDLDRTGLVWRSRDTAGVQTTYSYDALGRLASIVPTGGASSTYTYSLTPTSTAAASATAQQWAQPPGSQPLTDSRYYYDSFGRMIQERRRTSTASFEDSWSGSATSYDALGRKTSASVPVALSSGSYGTISAPATTFQYDALSRLVQATAPDASITTTAYTGAQKTVRTSSVATSEMSETQVSTAEHYDPHARLIQVVENDGVSGAVSTTYQYDEGDRLTTVVAGVQTRAFTYDRAGLLTSEAHPESGTTSYLYDARGHVFKKVTPTATLKMTYDSGERLTTVADGSNVAIKEFSFSSASSGTDLSRGKLVQAIRHNQLPSAGRIDVTEGYEYKTTDGRMSRRSTLVEGVDSGGNRSTIQKFQYDVAYDTLGLVSQVTMPSCVSANPCTTTGSLPSVGYSRTDGLLTEVNGFGELRYHPSGMVAYVLHSSWPNSMDSYEIDSSSRMPRPKTISFSGGTTCAVPSPSITAPPSVCSNSTGNSASVTAVSGVTYQWTVTGGTITSGTTTNAITFQAENSGIVTLTLQATNTCGTGTASTTIDITPSTTSSTITAPSAVHPNSAGNTASVPQRPGITHAWQITGGTITSSTSGDSITFSANGSGSVTLNVTATGTCGSASSQVTVPILLSPPASVTATATSNLTVNLSWPQVSGASSYQIERTTLLGGAASFSTTTTATSFIDTAPATTQPVTYIYYVRAISSAGTSARGAFDYATAATSLFTHEVAPGSGIVQSNDVDELRKAIDAFRVAVGSPAVFSNQSPPAGGIQAAHVTALVDALSGGRQSVGWSAFAWSGVPAPAANGAIRAAHIVQLRDALR